MSINLSSNVGWFFVFFYFYFVAFFVMPCCQMILCVLVSDNIKKHSIENGIIPRWKCVKWEMNRSYKCARASTSYTHAHTHRINVDHLIGWPKSLDVWGKTVFRHCSRCKWILLSQWLPQSMADKHIQIYICLWIQCNSNSDVEAILSVAEPFEYPVHLPIPNA